MEGVNMMQDLGDILGRNSAGINNPPPPCSARTGNGEAPDKRKCPLPSHLSLSFPISLSLSKYMFFLNPNFISLTTYIYIYLFRVGRKKTTKKKHLFVFFGGFCLFLFSRVMISIKTI